MSSRKASTASTASPAGARGGARSKREPVTGTRTAPSRSRKPRKPRKAPNGQGGIGQTADGRWWARLTAEVDGRKKRLVAYAKDEDGARLALEELRTRRHRHELVAPDTLTVAKAVEQYIALKVAGGLGSQTVNGYRLTLSKYLAPYLGGVRVQALTAARIQSHYLYLLTEGRSRPNSGRKAPDGSPLAGLSANTVIHVHRLLRPALELTRRNKVITTNPAQDVVLPRLGDKPIAAVLDRDQLGVLAAGAVADERWGAFWLLLVETGARQSELLGLAWKHVDWKARSITIAGSLNRHNRALATTKNRSSKRVLGLSAQAILSLQSHRVRQDADRAAAGPDYPPAGSDRDLVFARPDGSPWGAKSAYDAFKVLLASLDLPGNVHLHGVRHSVASALLTGEDAIDIPTVGKLLGHTSPATTAGVYAHVLQKQQDVASEQLHRILHRRAAAQ